MIDSMYRWFMKHLPLSSSSNNVVQDTEDHPFETAAVLKESEINFRLIFEYAVESILIVQNNRIQICNPVVQSLTGYTMEELLQKPFIEFACPEYRKAAAENYYDRLAGREVAGSQQYRILKKTGEMAWVDTNGIRIDWNGQPAVQYFIIDITEQKKAEQALRASEEKYRLITEFASDLIWVFNYTQYKFTYISPSVLPMLGYLPEEALRLDLGELIPEEYLHQARLKFPQRIEEFAQDPGINPAYVVEMQNIHLNGMRIWVESSSRYRYNADHEIEIVGVSRNITERKQLEQKALYLSYHDSLTGLYNRRFYEEELKRIDRIDNLPITLVLADVNGLKMTNDAFGHIAGDELLIRITGILKRACRNDDLIARIGGDEFILLFPCTDQAEAEGIVNRIKQLLLLEKYEKGILSVSFGSSTKQHPQQAIESLFIEAENTMYLQKLDESSSMRNETITHIIHDLHNSCPAQERHHHRVSMLCEQIARAMGMSNDEALEVAQAGRLHDIGKFGMDEHLLNLSGPFSEKDWVEYKRHPEKGYQILKASPEYSHLAQYVLCHHERLNGTGYPRGIHGDDIPLQARILSVANYYDTLTHPRGSSIQLDKQTAIRELRKNTGTEFDEEIVRVLIERVLHDCWEEKN